MKDIKRLDIELSNRAYKSIAHGALTNSKRPESFVKGVYPQHIKKGQGAYVFDTYGNRYIDFICGLGANLIGYAEEEIVQAICAQAKNGTSLSLGTDVEIKCAEKVKELFPFVDLVRFLKTGTEACMASIIIARSKFKGAKRDILSDGYHGWSPEFTSLTPPARGIAPHFNIVKFKDPQQITKHVAAVIIEPVMVDHSKERKKYLEDVRKKCDETGAILIFDEVITGGRFANYSVAFEYDVKPDLICLGKAIAGGMPLSIVAGRKELMEGDYFVSSTFAGETLSLAACIKTIELLQNKYSIATLWEKGSEFLFKFNEIWRDGIHLEGYPTRMVLKAESELTKALFMQECCKAGILVGPSFFFTFSHIPLIDECISVFQDIMMRIKLGQIQLTGEFPRAAYAQTIRGD